jgi:hypothetical protein
MAEVVRVGTNGFGPSTLYASIEPGGHNAFVILA